MYHVLRRRENLLWIPQAKFTALHTSSNYALSAYIVRNPPCQTIKPEKGWLVLFHIANMSMHTWRKL